MRIRITSKNLKDFIYGEAECESLKKDDLLTFPALALKIPEIPNR